jgi:hypothetical protein
LSTRARRKKVTPLDNSAGVIFTVKLGFYLTGTLITVSEYG